MNIDRATAGMLSMAIINADIDKQLPDSIDTVNSLYKKFKEELSADRDGGPNEAQIAWVNAHIGKRCNVVGTDHSGVIHSLNDADSGFYPGGRYPVYVKVESGEIYEYAIGDVATAMGSMREAYSKPEQFFAFDRLKEYKDMFSKYSYMTSLEALELAEVRNSNELLAYSDLLAIIEKHALIGDCND